MTKKTEKSRKAKLRDLFAPHEVDVSGFSPVVQARFAEAIERIKAEKDKMYFLDDMERAMIGTAMVQYVPPRESGADNEKTESPAPITKLVAVYERELAIKCKMESYGSDWADNIGTYTAEERADEGFMQGELYTLACDDFGFNTLRSLPYKHEYAPVIFEAFHEGDERSDLDQFDEPVVAHGDSRFDDALIGTYENGDGDTAAVYDIGLLGDRLDDLLKTLGDGPKPLLLNHFKVDDGQFETFRKTVNEEEMEKLMYA